MKISFSSSSAEAPRLTRLARRDLVDQVVREAQRDPMFAALLSSNLRAAGVALPAPDDDGGSRAADWSDRELLRLLVDYSLLRQDGLTGRQAHEQLAAGLGRGVSAGHVANMLTAARKTVRPYAMGPTLRKIVLSFMPQRRS